ncbi:MAG: M23 family metallopeptidase [Proteobacteria bacterium]|nr:M23 family metallopeptidase [Pseudomonadota bacterium]
MCADESAGFVSSLMKTSRNVSGKRPCILMDGDINMLNPLFHSRQHISIYSLFILLNIKMYVFVACSSGPETMTSYEQDVYITPTASSQMARERNARGLSRKYVTINQNALARTVNGKFCYFAKGIRLRVVSVIDEYGVVEVQTPRALKRCDSQSIFMFDTQDIALSTPEFQALTPHDTQGFNAVHHNTEKFYRDLKIEYSSPLSYSNPQTSKSLKKMNFFFPLFARPLDDYTVDGRGFGASRAYGRKHAATDLLEYSGYPVYAVADGKIIDFYYFYDGTNAIVVDHYDFVVRYGEVSKMAYPLRVGTVVRSGQKIGFVGMLGSGNSMLHFEQYTGELSGLLTVRKNYPFQRRKDLVDPTRFLHNLEKRELYPTE